MLDLLDLQVLALHQVMQVVPHHRVGQEKLVQMEMLDLLDLQVLALHQVMQVIQEVRVMLEVREVPVVLRQQLVIIVSKLLLETHTLQQ